MRTSRIFWSLLLLFLSLTAAARAQGDRDSLAAATTDPLTVQTAGGNSLAAGTLPIRPISIRTIIGRSMPTGS